MPSLLLLQNMEYSENYMIYAKSHMWSAYPLMTVGLVAPFKR